MATRFPEFIESTKPLAKAAEWSSGAQKASTRESLIVVSAYADQTGVLHIEQGLDGKNWDVDTTHTIKAEGEGFTEPIVAEYWRVRFVNGESEQKAFRIAAGAKSSNG